MKRTLALLSLLLVCAALMVATPAAAHHCAGGHKNQPGCTPPPPPPPPPTCEPPAGWPTPNVVVTDRATLATTISGQPVDAVIGLQDGIYNMAGHTTRALALHPKDGQKFVACHDELAVLDGANVGVAAFDSETSRDNHFYGLRFQNFAAPNTGGLGIVKLGAPVAGHVFDDNRFTDYTGRAIFTAAASSVDGSSGPTHMRRNAFVRGDHVGSGFRGNGSEVAFNEIAFMNPRGGVSDPVTKWVGNHNLWIHDNWSHDNAGHGLWVDANNLNVTIEGNLAERNTQSGVHYEVSYQGVVRNNDLLNNGTGLLLVSSRDVEVHGNDILDNTHGVHVWDQIRLDSPTASGLEWRLVNARIHNNVIRQHRAVSPVQVGLSGLQTWNEFTNSSIAGYDWSAAGLLPKMHFFANAWTYTGTTEAGANYWLENSLRSLASWRAAGQDTVESGSTFTYN